LTPSCIVHPNKASDLSALLPLLTIHNTSFAIKSGGHAPSAGFANIGSNGLTIDMAKLSAVEVNADASIAHIGVGAHWLDVYTALDPLNRIVAGGRNGAVGVGGLTLGGGISYFSPQVGFTCDSLVNVEIVLASGQVVSANASNAHHDLFRALKGGGNNFGVVTRMDFKTLELPVGLILAGKVVTDVRDRGAVFKVLDKLTNAPVYDVHASIVTSFILTSATHTWTVSSAPIYTLPEANPPAYADLFAIPSPPNITNTMAVTQLHVLAKEPDASPPPVNYLFYTTTFGVSVPLLNDIFDYYNETIYDFDEVVGMRWILSLEPFPTVIASHGGKGAKSNALGTSEADGNSMVILITAIWSPSSTTSSTDHEALVDAKAKELITGIDAAAQKRGLGRKFRYANYAHKGQNIFRNYGSANLAFLKKVQKKYDVTGVFERLVPGGLKLQGTTP
jgi:hypothetical protein